jgi:hypothetical protein
MSSGLYASSFDVMVCENIEVIPCSPGIADTVYWATQKCVGGHVWYYKASSWA